MNNEDWDTFWGISPDLVYTIATDGCLSSGADTYLRLYDINMNLLASDDESGPGACSQITKQFSTGDAYYVQVTDYFGEYACYTDYDIRIWSFETESNNSIATADRLNESASTHISVFKTLVEGYISSTSDLDYFRVYGEAFKTITVDLIVPSGVDYDLKLEDLSGTVVASSQNGGSAAEHINFVVPGVAYGPYVIHIYSYSGSSTSAVYECYVNIH
mgnify:CR=1 FL=1